MTCRVSVTATTSETFPQNHSFPPFKGDLHKRRPRQSAQHTAMKTKSVITNGFMFSLVLKVSHCSFFKKEFKRTNTTERVG